MLRPPNFARTLENHEPDRGYGRSPSRSVSTGLHALGTTNTHSALVHAAAGPADTAAVRSRRLKVHGETPPNRGRRTSTRTRTIPVFPHSAFRLPHWH